MLFDELNQLQEEFQYHSQQLTLLEERINEIKAYQAYAVEGIESVKTVVENLGVGKYLWLFKEEVLKLFPQEPPQYLEEKHQPNIPKKIKVVDRPEIAQQPVKTKAELFGRPDLTPTTFTDLSKRVVYSSEGRCYLGFNDHKLAKDYGEKLKDYYEFSSGYIVDKPNFLMDYKWELKFWCSENNAKRLVALNFDKELAYPDNQLVIKSWQYPLPKEETPKPFAFGETTKDNNSEILVISEDIKYDLDTLTAYIAGKSKGRLRAYGDLLCFQYTIGDKYVVSDQPTHFPDSKYELRILEINQNNVEHLAKFNLSKEPNHSENALLLKEWADLKKLPIAVEKDKPYPLELLEQGDIIHKGRPNDRYTVVGMKKSQTGELFVEALCSFHSEFVSLIGQTVLLKEVFLVEKSQVLAPSNDEVLASPLERKAVA